MEDLWHIKLSRFLWRILFLIFCEFDFGSWRWAFDRTFIMFLYLFKIKRFVSDWSFKFFEELLDGSFASSSFDILGMFKFAICFIIWIFLFIEFMFEMFFVLLELLPLILIFWKEVSGEVLDLWLRIWVDGWLFLHGLWQF